MRNGPHQHHSPPIPDSRRQHLTCGSLTSPQWSVCKEAREQLQTAVIGCGGTPSRRPEGPHPPLALCQIVRGPETILNLKGTLSSRGHTRFLLYMLEGKPLVLVSAFKSASSV
jgi:hypothetical protein